MSAMPPSAAAATAPSTLRRGVWGGALPSPGWTSWFWAAGAAALIGWFAAPLPADAPALVKPRRDTWVMAPLPRIMDQTTLAAQVMGAPYWGAAPGGAAAAAATPVDPRWRLAAVFGVGRERGVLVEFLAPDKPPLRLKAGDTLPSGHRITRIDEGGICVQIGARSYRLGVERSAS